ncbi:conserved hypothetical protein [Burkholderia sp. 8Y]|nr:conserved hypothetical protein [Burkholderia sp. 8Y]
MRCAQKNGEEVPETIFAAFGTLTLLMAYVWVRGDARGAFSAAVKTRQVGTVGAPPRLVYISQNCARRWLVLLYVELHPELIDPDLDDG